MKTKYDLGEYPTNDEWKAYYKCERYNYAEDVACWLEEYDEEVTQGQFDTIVDRLSKCTWGESVWECIWYIYNDVMGR